MKPGEVAQIEFIKTCLRNGLQRKAIMGKFGKKWEDISRTTFDRRLKAASQAMQKEVSAIKKGTRNIIDKEIEARKEKIMGALERQEVLTAIARGEIPLQKPMVCDGLIQKIEVVPDWMDRKNAIAELNKMDGAYAPSKAETTILKGWDEFTLEKKA